MRPFIAACRLLSAGAAQAPRAPAPGLAMHPGLTVVVLACGILVPPPEIKPTSSALAGGCLTTGPPGKSQKRLDFCQMFFMHLMK